MTCCCGKPMRIRESRPDGVLYQCTDSECRKLAFSPNLKVG